nr:Uncharacterized protein TCM_001093 [Ipomoea batatas]GMC62340.1 Uncharacterized protein TCM_001093 [Ipomoea batatas]GMC67481.1 Uncharacterized protein TCM_001093 [Ipomoea batatas]GME01199.1 Uncharacterized protein TCM_001093 [Ipomoea batatas]
MSVSIEALAMAGADYLEFNVELESSLIPSPHLLADDEGQEFWWKKPSSIPATSYQESKNLVPYQSESNHADPVLNEDDLITTMNLSRCRKDEDEVVCKLLLLKLMSFTASFKKEKLVSCCLSGERRNFGEKMMALTVLGFIQGLEDTISCF